MDPQIAAAFRHIPYGIYILAVQAEGEPRAMVVSWVSQISYHPPMLMVALRSTRPLISDIRDRGFFSLSLLSTEQKSLVERFKAFSSFPQLSGILRMPGPAEPESAPVLKEAMASWQCRVQSFQEAGDHLLLIGRVQSASSSFREKPLTTLDYGKTYIGQT